MGDDLKEFDKLIKEKKISDVDEMLEESKKITRKIPNLQEKHEKVVNARGNVIEASIKIEMAFDELITKTGGEDLVLDSEKKEFHLITGAIKEEEIRGSQGLRFHNKMELLKKILMKVEKEQFYQDYIQSEEWKKKDKEFVNRFQKCKKCGSKENLGSFHINCKNIGNEGFADVEVLCWIHQMEKQIDLEMLEIPEPPLLADLERIIKLRNIFAHVPVSWFAKDLEFDDNLRYEHYFRLDKRWKNISFAVKEFMNLQKEILKLIEVYMRGVVLKREIFSKILLGKSYKEILEGTKDTKNPSK